MQYELIQIRNGHNHVVANVIGYPEAVLTAQALSSAGPVSIDGGVEFKTRAEWDEHVEGLRRLVQPV